MQIALSVIKTKALALVLIGEAIRILVLERRIESAALESSRG